MKKCIVIVGPTGSGKTALSITLAQHYQGEVVSADSRQVYTGLDIGTGKVTEKEKDGVPHHLLDVADPRTIYTASDFVHDASSAVSDIWKRNKLPIIIGGTGFYIDALCGRSRLSTVPPNESLREELATQETDTLFTRLQAQDPARASDLTDKGEESHRRRIIRALEIAQSPGVTEIQTPLGTQVEYLWIGIDWNNEALKERIATRARVRTEDEGMIEEAQKLHDHDLSFERMRELGLEYGLLADYLEGKISKDTLIAQIEQQSWKYVKRQRTWFKRNTDIHWFDGTALDAVQPLVQKFLMSE